MKQYQLQQQFGINQLQITEIEIPEAKAGEVLVRLHAASLNYRDYFLVTGNYPLKMNFPIVPISDGAGEIVSVGAGITDLAPGDRVVTQFLPAWKDGNPTEAILNQTLGGPLPGMLSEYVVLTRAAVTTFPNYLSYAEAATLPVAGLAAWSALAPGTDVMEADGLGRSNKPEKNAVQKFARKTIVVQGTGGVALFVAQFATALGARIILTSGSDTKLSKVRSLGLATKTINYNTYPEWQKEVRKLTGGQGADLVVDVVGNTMNQSLEAIRAGGEVAAVGLLGSPTFTLNIVPLLQHKKRITGVQVGSLAAFHQMITVMEKYQIHPIIGKTFDFEQAREAFELLGKGGTFGKIVIAITPKR